MIGLTSSSMMADLPRIELLTMPSAADAPSAIAMPADIAATIRDVQNARIQFESEKNCSYQRSEKPGGGKVR